MKRFAVLLAVALLSLLAALAVAGLPRSVKNDVVITERPTATPTTPVPTITAPPETTTERPTSTETTAITSEPTSTTSGETRPEETRLTPTTSPPTTAPAPTTLAPPAGLRVVVVNGTSQPGLSADNAAILNSLGYPLTTPTDAVDKDVATTDLFFSNGYRGEARQLANLLSIDPDGVDPVPSEPITVQTVDGDLWLLLGADRVP